MRVRTVCFSSQCVHVMLRRKLSGDSSMRDVRSDREGVKRRGNQDAHWWSVVSGHRVQHPSQAQRKLTSGPSRNKNAHRCVIQNHHSAGDPRKKVKRKNSRPSRQNYFLWGRSRDVSAPPPGSEVALAPRAILDGLIKRGPTDDQRMFFVTGK